MDFYTKTRKTHHSWYITHSVLGFDANLAGSIPATDSFNGYRNPGWRDAIKKGQNAGTPANGVHFEIDPGWFSASVVYNNGLTDQHYGVPFLTSLWEYDSAVAPPDVYSRVTNRVISKFIEACDSARSSFEAGQDLGEIKQTLESIIHPMNSMKNLTLGYFDKLKKAGRGHHTKVSLHKAIADTYLEYRFGWRPLAFDISAGISDLTNNQGHPTTTPVRASASEIFAGVDSGNWDPTGGIGFSFYKPRGTVSVTSRFSMRYIGSVRTGSENGRISLAQNLQLDLPHFLPTIWDLLPYSWIADYFTNIGDIIKAASFRNFNIAWGMITTRVTNEYKYLYSPLFGNSYFPPVSYYLVSDNSEPCNPSATSTYFNRYIFTPSDLIPTFQFSVPLSSRPWENIGALLTSRGSSVSKFFKNLI